VGKYFGPKWQVHFVTGELGLVVEAPRQRHRLGRRRQLAENLFPQVAAVGLLGTVPGFDGRRVGLGPELFTSVRRTPDEHLREVYELLKLSPLPHSRIESGARIGRRVPQGLQPV